jgi:hypothetical protein
MKMHSSVGLALFMVWADAVGSQTVSGQEARNASPPPAAQLSAPAPDAGRSLAALSAGRQVLIPADLERTVIERFKNGYTKLGKPKVALLFNRDPALEGAPSSLRSTLNAEAAFGRPFRDAGAVLVKQSASPDQSTPPANAELRIQIALSIKPCVWTGAALVVTNNLLDASAEATLADGRVLGHAMTSDFVPADEAKAFTLLRKVGTDEIIKATALALMDDIMMSLAANSTLADASAAPSLPSGDSKPSGTETPAQAQGSSETSANPPPTAAASDKPVATAPDESKAANDQAAASETQGRKQHSAPVVSASGAEGATPSTGAQPSPADNSTSNVTRRADSAAGGVSAHPPATTGTNYLTAAVLKGLVHKTLGDM